MLTTRLEKLRFIVEELNLAFFLTTHVTDPFAARSLARHILVRAKDFVEHTRQLRKPLNQAGHDTSEFHSAKESYAAQFDEYFQLPRDRLGAHVQDLDFGSRVELWQAIEIGKISYFVDGATEIYQRLALLNIPGYIAYSAPPEIINPAVVGALQQFQRDLDAAKPGAELAAYSLGVTQGNGLAPLNETPVHQRAAQLSLIRRWIKLEMFLFDKCRTYPGIVRILKARVITDVVSFCDCLVTRLVTPGAPQEMDGLDKLVRANGQTPVAIDAFVANTRFADELASLRVIRDEIGAHLETRPSQPLHKLQVNLDSYDGEHAIYFYSLAAAAFHQTCLSILYLKLYASDGSQLVGVTPSHSNAVAYADDGTENASVPPERPRYDDREEYEKNLRKWLLGDQTQQNTARHYFYNAFQYSEVVQQIIETVDLRGGIRREQYSLRTAHTFLESAIAGAASDEGFRRIVELAKAAGYGSPYEVSEVLVRNGRNGYVARERLICRALGHLASVDHHSVRMLLAEYAGSPSWHIRLEAAIARFRIFIIGEGHSRVGPAKHQVDRFDVFVPSVLKPMSADERLVSMLAFASVIRFGHRTSFYAPQFQDDYSNLKKDIENALLPIIGAKGDPRKVDALLRLLETDDYVSLTTLAIFELDSSLPLRGMLVDACCDGNIALSPTPQSALNLAQCLQLVGETGQVLRIYEQLANGNPSSAELHVMFVEVLAQYPGLEEAAATRLRSVRRTFVLTKDQENRLTAVQGEIQSRPTVPH